MADNPYVNKVEYNGETLIDLTNDTVSAETLVAGVTAHLPSGASVTGTFDPTVFEEKSNKVTSWTSTTTNTHYPSEKLVKDSLDSKVDKVTGKGLTTNDYDNTEKGNVSANTVARHTHSNKDLLDTYTQTETDLASAVTNTHTHSNKSVIDGIASTDVTNWNGKANQSDVTTIQGKIPNEATSTNQLADKDFVNSSVSTNTAYFRGTSASGLTESQFLEWANSLTKTNNDYVFWNTTDTDGNVVYKRYKYNGTTWVYEFSLNNSSFTANQWASINSGITSSNVTDIGLNTTNRHTHSNKSTLDGITSSNVNSWNSKEDSTNKVTTLSAQSTDTQYPSAKCVYDLIGNVESLLSNI